MLAQLFLDASGQAGSLDGTVALVCPDALELAPNLP